MADCEANARNSVWHVISDGLFGPSWGPQISTKMAGVKSAILGPIWAFTIGHFLARWLQGPFGGPFRGPLEPIRNRLSDAISCICFIV